MEKYIKDISKLNIIRKKNLKKKIVLAHGVFDVFHIGHLRHLEKAKKYGDILIVSVTSDRYVRKGPGRPHFSENIRAEILSSIKIVDYVYINESETSVNILQQLKPDFYIKGKDYKNLNKDITKNIFKEKKAVEKNKGKLIFTDEITHSSSNLINNFLSNEKEKNQIKY